MTPHIFEASEHLGGLWSPKSKICRPTLRTNLSRHTCCFSDLAWPKGTPTFPTAVQVGEYLKTYAERYLKEVPLHFGSRVTSVKWAENNEKWRVSWEKEEKESQEEFDSLVIASGFFTEPHIPSIPGLDQFHGTVLHSSAHTSPEAFKDKHVAIIGGSLSSVEVADDIALYAASIHHVISKPFWIIPRYLATRPDDPGSNFLPLDVLFYSNRRPEVQGASLQERWRHTNKIFTKLVGDPSQVSELLKIDLDLPTPVVISDTYANYVRSGRIHLHLGHLISVADSQLQVTHENTTEILPPEITHIVFATGFRPSSSLSFLPEHLLSAFEFSPNDNFLPFLLHHEMIHPSFPNAAFVGHYRGPYWGIIELQARYASGLLSGGLLWPTEAEMREGITMQREVRDMRPRMQFPRGDYVTFGRDIAKAMKTPVVYADNVSEEDEEHDPAYEVFGPHLFARPRWFLSENYDEQEKLFCLLNDTLEGSVESGLFIAAAVFRSLHGVWDLNRVYTSRRPEYPSGPSVGTAEFIPRKASQIEPSNSNVMWPIEYLYAEKAELTTANGSKYTGTQHYLYRYDEPQDRIEVFFTKRDKAFTLDYLFHYIKMQSRTEEEIERKAPWQIKAVHPCGQDIYDVAYTFYFKGPDLEKWKIEYEVRGPRKDYTMATWYTRPQQRKTSGDSKI